MLTGQEILNLVNNGEIRITPFNEKQLNPNSYNLKIGDTISYYPSVLETFEKPFFEKEDNNKCIPDIMIHRNFEDTYLDSKRDNYLKTVKIPEDGIILKPGILYLANTEETTYAGNLIPCLSGRSSFARLGMEIHRTAGFGDIGVDLQWTLEITVVHPLKIYPHQEICQIYFEKPDGDTNIKYNGKYQNSKGTIGSRSFLDK